MLPVWFDTGLIWKCFGTFSVSSGSWLSGDLCGLSSRLILVFANWVANWTPEERFFVCCILKHAKQRVNKSDYI